MAAESPFRGPGPYASALLKKPVNALCMDALRNFVPSERLKSTVPQSAAGKRRMDGSDFRQELAANEGDY
jgi:hypothetical protein